MTAPKHCGRQSLLQTRGRAQSKTRTSGRVQSRFDQAELGLVREREGEGSVSARKSKVRESREFCIIQEMGGRGRGDSPTPGLESSG